jgi:hypothetical protein
VANEIAVTFLTIEGKPCLPDQRPARFTFPCIRAPGEPGFGGEVNTCGMLLIANAGHGIKRDPQNKNGGTAQWDWNGNRDCPTFTPSVDAEPPTNTGTAVVFLDYEVLTLPS